MKERRTPYLRAEKSSRKQGEYVMCEGGRDTAIKRYLRRMKKKKFLPTAHAQSPMNMHDKTRHDVYDLLTPRRKESMKASKTSYGHLSFKIAPALRNLYLDRKQRGDADRCVCGCVRAYLFKRICDFCECVCGKE